MKFKNLAPQGGLQPWGRFAIIAALLAAVVGLLGPATTPALAGPPPAPVAQTNLPSTLTMTVVSARDEPNHPNPAYVDPVTTPNEPETTPVFKGDVVPEFKYLINVDNTGDPWQPRNAGCSPDYVPANPGDPGYPASCDWPSIREVPGAAPIFTQGNQDDFNGVNPPISLPPGKYLISVLAEGYKMDGEHFTVPGNGSPVVIEVGMHPHPLPSATLRIRVFEDISPVNGQPDAPAEGGLPGFHAIVNDTAGEVSTDVFGNPLCTSYDAAGNINGHYAYDANGNLITLPGAGGIDETCAYSNVNGDIVIPNLGPLRYDVLVVPPDGTDWIETTTLEGSPSWDTWLAEGGTGLDNEFVVAAEPFPWTIFGFTKPMDTLNNPADTGGVKGTLVSASVYLPQTGGLPYYGDIWNGFNGTKITGPIQDGWVALSSFQNGDTAVYVAQANADGTFQIDNVPDGNYLFTWWDNNLHHLLDWIQVTVSNGQMYDMGTPMLTGWFTEVDGYVFDDANFNGVKDPGEAGIPNYLVVLRDRDNSEIDRMSIAVTTDENGYYVFEKAYPMNSWMVLEAYNDRYYTTGVTYQVENQPTPTTVLGAGVDVGLLPVLGQAAKLDWGVHAYDPTGSTGGIVPQNGGIVGSVFYDTTRNELDPRFQAAEPWAPGIPGLTMNLWSTVDCTDPNTQTCDARGDYQLDTDGSYLKGSLLNTTTTETWEMPTGCTARDAKGNILAYPADQALFANPGPATYECIEAPMMGTQIQEGFATLDGNWGFGEGCFTGTLDATDPANPVCNGGTFDPLTAGDYLVEVAIPQDTLGRDKYKVVREEDINVFNGDQYSPAVPPPACAGALHTVDVAGVGADGANATSNPSFSGEGGSPYEGMQKPLCDTKLVPLNNGKSVAPIFTLFTDVPIPGKWKGYIIDDLTVSTNKQDMSYGEKAGIPHSPIGVYDWSNRLVANITSDPNGVYEILLPSTHTMNCPSPSGVCSNMYYILGNDPGQPQQANPNYNPQYRTIGATFEIYPGLIIPSDLAPTQIVPGVLAPGSAFGVPPQCTLNDPAAPDTPELWAVSQPYADITGGDGAFTIQGQGFGAQGAGSQVTLDGVALPVTSWSDTDIAVTVPATTPSGPHQLAIKSNSGLTSVNGLTFHVLDSAGYYPPVYEVGPGRTFDTTPTLPTPATIQDAIDAAGTSNGLVVIYPDTPVGWNPTGIYYENLLINAPVKLQGIGPGGVYTNQTAVLGSVVDGRGVAGDTGYAAQWLNDVQALTWDGIQAIYEGPVMYVLARDGEFTDTFKASIDGIRIQGGDQQGFPNNLQPVNPTQKEVAAVQGGGIFVNGYARHLQITNNILESNGGAYAGAIRLGTPNVVGALNDNQNDFVRIANNRILSNGGTNLAGAVGIFSGAEGYEVANNDVCGNFSAEYGGGISHYGFSPGGKIHDNRVYFNRSYDEGGGIIIAGELPANPATLSPGAGPVDVYNNLIQANLGNDDGGGLRFLMANNFPYNVYNNIIVNNISTHEGGGVSLNDTPNVRFYNNTVMKNITTATATTSNGQPAPAGLSSSLNSTLLQATLPATMPVFSDPLLFNNIFWENRAGTFSGAAVSGIGLTGDPNPINYWDLGLADPSGLLSPTSSMLQVTTGTIPNGSNSVGVDPKVVTLYDTSVSVAPWRGNPRFVDTVMVTTVADPNILGNYHLKSASPAVDAAVLNKVAANNEVIATPGFDIDNDLRPMSLLNAPDIGADETPGPMPPAIRLHFSTNSNGSIPDVVAPYDNADIYTWDGGFFGSEFDASAAGLAGNANIDGLALDGGLFYISFARNGGTNVPGLDPVQDEDVVSYNPANNEWKMFFKGIDRCSLSANNQDVDAIDVKGGTLYFSTRGNGAVQNVAGPYDAADIYTWTGGNNCARLFDADVDGSLPGNANIDGLTVFDNNTFFLSFTGDGVLTNVQNEDIVLYDANTWTLHFDGTAKGIDAAHDLDAIWVPAGAPMIAGQRALTLNVGKIFLPVIMKTP